MHYSRRVWSFRVPPPSLFLSKSLESSDKEEQQKNSRLHSQKNFVAIGQGSSLMKASEICPVFFYLQARLVPKKLVLAGGLAVTASRCQKSLNP